MTPPDAGRVEGRLQRDFSLVAAMLYPLWGLLCQALLPASQNDLAGRLVVAGLLVAIALAITWRPAVAARAEHWLAAACAVLMAHYLYLVLLNGVAAFYVTGVFITLGAIDAMFQREPPLAAFSVVSVLAAAPVAFGGGPLGIALVAGVAMQQGLFYFTLRQRRVLERHLERQAHELAEQNTRLKEVDRLKDELIGSVSHELRTPLHAIRAYTELLAEEMEDDLAPDHAIYLRRITQSAARLQTQIDDLLDVARLEGGAMRMIREPMDPREVAAAVLATLEPQARAKDLALTTDLAPDLPALMGDEERVAQVALNLVGNAVKFAPMGGHVVLAIQRDADGVRFEVRDDGPGVPAAEQALIFEKFYQSNAPATRHQGGAGLGLAICRGIVDAHGGRLGVESPAGGGACFWFWLPAGDVAAAG